MKKTNNIKNITIEYYNTCSFVKVNPESSGHIRAKTNIEELLKTFQNKKVQDKAINYNGENLILSSITYNKSSKLLELVFFKSRSATVPFIINNNGDSRQIFLEKDEMISEVLCAEYDSDSRILAMQRNVYAIGTRGLEEFFSSFLSYPLYLESIQTLNEEKNYVKKIQTSYKKC